MHNLLSDRFIGIAGFLVGIVGVALAIYYGNRGEKKRQPTFSLMGYRERLAAAVIHKFGDFALLHKGTAITEGDIVGTWFRFWNSGTLPILSEDVLTQYAAVFPEGCRVLDVQIQAVSRKEVHAEATFETNEIRIKVAVLEPNDGLRIQCLYNGPIDAKLEFRGSCIGSLQPMVLSPEDVRDVPIGKNFRTSVLSTLRPILTIAVLGVIFKLLAGTVRHHLPHFVHYLFWTLAILFFALLSGLFLLLFWQWISKKSLPKTLSNG